MKTKVYMSANGHALLAAMMESDKVLDQIHAFIEERPEQPRQQIESAVCNMIGRSSDHQYTRYIADKLYHAWMQNTGAFNDVAS